MIRFNPGSDDTSQIEHVEFRYSGNEGYYGGDEYGAIRLAKRFSHPAQHPVRHHLPRIGSRRHSARHIYNSAFANIQNFAVFMTVPPEADARYNRGATAVVPITRDLNPKGVGEPVSNNVSFDPWLKTPKGCRPST
ncbi:MAG: hypothetical protein R2873_34525 [Caldilineaceae bacterium]